jgi:FMN hydrolase / 5-amino-6-(5-phospho-D-ribitylamino)uracil phosphatase
MPGAEMTSQTEPRNIPRGFDTRLDPVPKLVLFDLDNTLCDHATSLAERVSHAFEPFFTGDDLERATLAAIARSSEGTAHFTEVLSQYGVDEPNAAEVARERYISDRYRGLKLYSDTLDAITRVKAIASIGMITNGPTDIQQPKIDLLEIEQHFPFILISESVGIWKPDPAIFQMALDIAGLPAADAIYVGDSHIADIPGARAAGMRSVWINRAGVDWPGEDPPDVEIHDLFELLICLGISS